jgi:hypothetical protein
MAQWHSMDLTNFDLAPAARTAQKFSGAIAHRATGAAQDATYIAVGLGLIAFQKVQVQRHNLAKSRRN